MADEMVKVEIRCEAVIVYRKTVSVPASVVAEYNAACCREEDDAWFHDFAERYIDPLTDEAYRSDYEDVELTVAT